MTERDKELWEKSQQWDSSDDGRGKLKILESVEKFADLIRSDEREVCLTLCRKNLYACHAYEDIRARGNT